jgi:hypothetical protein
MGDRRRKSLPGTQRPAGPRYAPCDRQSSVSRVAFLIPSRCPGWDRTSLSGLLQTKGSAPFHKCVEPSYRLGGRALASTSTYLHNRPSIRGQLLARSCPKERVELSPLCAGDSDIGQVGDSKIVVEFDATCIRPYVRFFEVGRSQGRCSFPSPGVPEADAFGSHPRNLAKCMATISSARIQPGF